MNRQRKIRLMVSSSVISNEETLRKVFTILKGYGYEVWMSYKGSIPLTPKKTAFENCLAAVESCDVFFGIITGRYGSGKEKPNEPAITHLEIRRAIELNKSRFFAVHTNVTIARELLGKFRYDENRVLRPSDFFDLKGNKIIDDIRILDMYDEATLKRIELSERRGNWVQPYTVQEELYDFLATQFADPKRIWAIIEDDNGEENADEAV